MRFCVFERVNKKSFSNESFSGYVTPPLGFLLNASVCCKWLEKWSTRSHRHWRTLSHQMDFGNQKENKTVGSVRKSSERTNNLSYRQSFLIMLDALRVMILGNSTASIPRTINVYVCIGSVPENGGLQNNDCQGDELDAIYKWLVINISNKSLLTRVFTLTRWMTSLY